MKVAFPSAKVASRLLSELLFSFIGSPFASFSWALSEETLQAYSASDLEEGFVVIDRLAVVADVHEPDLVGRG